jgi:hypothetical protein
MRFPRLFTAHSADDDVSPFSRCLLLLSPQLLALANPLKRVWSSYLPSSLARNWEKSTLNHPSPFSPVRERREERVKRSFRFPLTSPEVPAKTATATATTTPWKYSYVTAFLFSGGGGISRCENRLSWPPPPSSFAPHLPPLPLLSPNSNKGIFHVPPNPFFLFLLSFSLVRQTLLSFTAKDFPPPFHREVVYKQSGSTGRSVAQETACRDAAEDNVDIRKRFLSLKVGACIYLSPPPGSTSALLLVCLLRMAGGDFLRFSIRTTPPE